METTILTLEITPELDNALGEIAKSDLVTKEDIARGIIAVQMAQAMNGKSGLFGLSHNTVAVLISGITGAIAEALAMGNKGKPTEKEGE